MSNTRDRIDAEARKDPRRLEAEIDRQRDSIGNIVDALESKLTPGQLVDQMIGAGNGTAGDFARNLGNAVKANPVPTMLAATGLAWLYASRNNPAPTPVYGVDHSGNGIGAGLHDGASHLRDSAGALRDGASQRWSNATSKVGDAAHGIGERAHHAADTVRDRSRQAGSSLNHMLHENPLAAGAIAISIGALIGALLPMSEQENRYMGETGDKLRGKAGEMADSMREKGAEVAQELGQGQHATGDRDPAVRGNAGASPSSMGTSP